MGIVKTPWVQSLNEPGFESWLRCSPAINLVVTSVTLICLFSKMYTPTSKWDKKGEVPNHNQACLQVLKQEVPTTCFLYTCSRTCSIFVLVQFWIPTSFCFLQVILVTRFLFQTLNLGMTKQLCYKTFVGLFTQTQGAGHQSTAR